MRRIVPFFLSAVMLGCGGGSEPASKEKFITLEEWKKMAPHEKNDPYVLERLQKPPAKKR